MWSIFRRKKKYVQNAMEGKDLSINPPAMVSNLRKVSRLMRLLAQSEMREPSVAIQAEIIAHKMALKNSGFFYPETLEDAKEILNKIQGNANGHNV